MPSGGGDATITLHQLARVWDIPNLSPFCGRVWDRYFEIDASTRSPL